MTDDFGFTFSDSPEETSKKFQADLTSKASDVVKWKSKCSEMHSMIMPLLNNLKKNPDEEMEAYNLYVEKWFVFCLIWSIGATVEEQSRREIERTGR